MSDIADRLRWGATCPVSGPGGDLAKDMLEAAELIERLRAANATLVRWKGEIDGHLIAARVKFPDDYDNSPMWAIAKLKELSISESVDLRRDAEELANALRDVLAGHPVLNADELIARYSPLPERGHEIGRDCTCATQWPNHSTQSGFHLLGCPKDQRRPAAIQQGGNGVPLSSSSGPRGSDAEDEAPLEGVSGATNLENAVGTGFDPIAVLDEWHMKNKATGDDPTFWRGYHYAREALVAAQRIPSQYSLPAGAWVEHGAGWVKIHALSSPEAVANLRSFLTEVPNERK